MWLCHHLTFTLSTSVCCCERSYAIVGTSQLIFYLSLLLKCCHYVEKYNDCTTGNVFCYWHSVILLVAPLSFNILTHPTFHYCGDDTEERVWAGLTNESEGNSKLTLSLTNRNVGGGVFTCPVSRTRRLFWWVKRSSLKQFNAFKAEA